MPARSAPGEAVPGRPPPGILARVTPAPPRRCAVLLALAAGAALLPLAAALAGCASTRKGPLTRPALSYGAVQTLNPGVDGRWILEEFPDARSVERTPDGRLQRLTYDVLDPQGKTRRVVLTMDAAEVLAQKDYTGPLVRPTSPDREAGRLTAAPR